MVTKRDIRNFKDDKFIDDIADTDWSEVYTTDNANDKADIFERKFSTILDKHAPFKTFRVTRPPSPWLTDEIKAQMDLRDRYKNKFNQQRQDNEKKDITTQTFKI